MRTLRLFLLLLLMGIGVIRADRCGICDSASCTGCHYTRYEASPCCADDTYECKDCWVWSMANPQTSQAVNAKATPGYWVTVASGPHKGIKIPLKQAAKSTPLPRGHTADMLRYIRDVESGKLRCPVPTATK